MKHLKVVIEFDVEDEDFQGEELQEFIRDVKSEEAVNMLLSNNRFSAQNGTITLEVE